jgi:hypothetical protein
MKVILNVKTSFNRVPLKPSDEIDVPLNVGQRWISRGIAHPAVQIKEPKEVKRTEVKSVLVKKEKKSRKKKSSIKKEEAIVEDNLSDRQLDIAEDRTDSITDTEQY